MASTALASALLATGAQAQQTLIPGLGRGGNGGGAGTIDGVGAVDNPTGQPSTGGSGSTFGGGGGGGAGTSNGVAGAFVFGGGGGSGGRHDLVSSFDAPGETGTAGSDGGPALSGGGGGGGAGGYGLVVIGTGNLGTQSINRTGGEGGNGGQGSSGGILDSGGGGGSGGVGLFIGASAPNTLITGTVNGNFTGGRGGAGGGGFFAGAGGNGGSGIVFGNNTSGLLNGLPNTAPVSLTINGNVSGGNGGDGGVPSDLFTPPGAAGLGGAGIVANGFVSLVLNGSVSGGLSGSNRADALVFSGDGNTVTFGANYTQQGGVNVASGQLTILQNQDFTIAPNTGGNIFGTDVNAIYGAGSLRFTGSGTTTLTAENFYTGGTLIVNGNVAISNGGALGTGPIAFVNSGSLRATNSLLLDEQITISSVGDIFSFSAQTGTRFSLASQLTIFPGFFDSASEEEGFAENIITQRTLVFGSANDTGAVSLTGSAAVSGGGFEIRVAGGVLEGTSRRLSALTSAAAAVDIEAGATLRYSGVEAGQGIRFLIGEGNLIVNGQPPAAARPAPEGAANGPAPSQTGSQLTISQGNFSGVISGDGSLRVGALSALQSLAAPLLPEAPQDESFAENDAGAVILRLTGANTYTGTTTIDAGRELILGNGGTTGSIGAGDVINDGSLAFERSNTVTFANNISGTGQLFQVSPGTLILTGNNTYSGATNIFANSTLQVGAGQASGSLGTGVVENAGTLAINRSDAVTLANVISGAGRLQHNGAGTTTLTGANTFSGGVGVNAGTLAVSNLASLGTGAVTVASGGTLQVTNAADVTFGLGLSGAGTLRKLGAGVLTFASPASIGTLAVDSGVARINSTLTGSVTVASGARVDGSGTIAGSVTNAGTFAPGVGLGGLTITGNYTQTAGGILEIDYSASGANIDLLTVNGAATLGGTVRFIASDSSEASGGTFLRATGGVTGAFSNVELVGSSGPVSVLLDPTTGSLRAPAPIIATTRPTTLVSQLDAQNLLLRSVFGTFQPGGIDGLDFGVEPGSQPRRRFWADGIGSTTEREARGDALSFNVDVYGTTFGGEFATGVRGLSVGGFASYVQTDIDLTASAGDGEQRGILGGAFIDWTHKATALRAGFVIGRIDQSTNRVVTFNGADETLEGDTNSNARSIFANAGHRFGRIAGWSVSGHLSSIYTRLRQDAFVEQGANPLAIAAPALGVEQWTGDLRLQTSRVLGSTDGIGPVLLRFAGGVSRTEAFGDRLVPVTLTNLGSEQLLDISTREETVGLFDAGVRWQLTKRGELRLNYQGRYGSDTSHAVQGGFSFRF